MSLQRGTVTKKIYDAINSASAGESGETAVGLAVRTAASQAAGRTAIGAGVGNVTMVAAPVSATAAGTVNSIAFDATHIYVCIATNTWVRAVVATF